MTEFFRMTKERTLYLLPQVRLLAPFHDRNSIRECTPYCLSYPVIHRQSLSRSRTATGDDILCQLYDCRDFTNSSPALSTNETPEYRSDPCEDSTNFNFVNINLCAVSRSRFCKWHASGMGVQCYSPIGRGKWSNPVNLCVPRRKEIPSTQATSRSIIYQRSFEQKSTVWFRLLSQ